MDWPDVHKVILINLKLMNSSEKNGMLYDLSYQTMRQEAESFSSIETFFVFNPGSGEIKKFTRFSREEENGADAWARYQLYVNPRSQKPYRIMQTLMSNKLNINPWQRPIENAIRVIYKTAEHYNNILGFKM